MTGNVAFLMKDFVLLAASYYLLKQDAMRVACPAAADRERDHRDAVPIRSALGA
jgi:hypothetical protein